MKNCDHQRQVHTKSARWLKKARHRYLLKVSAAIAADHSLLWAVAATMKKRSLYAASTPLEQIRWSVLRYMHKLEGRRVGTNDWWAWLLKNGWGKFGWREAA
jgi:hypothetical protein